MSVRDVQQAAYWQTGPMIGRSIQPLRYTMCLKVNQPLARCVWSMSGFDLFCCKQMYRTINGPSMSGLFSKRYIRYSISSIFNINFCLFFVPIHWWVLPLYTQYFPESCEKYHRHCYLGGFRTNDPCISRAVSYQLDYRDFPVARGSSNPILNIWV